MRPTPTSRGAWYPAPSMNHAHMLLSATVLQNGQILVIGGSNPPSVELFEYEMLPPPTATPVVPTQPTPSPTSSTAPTAIPTDDPSQAPPSTAMYVALATSIIAVISTVGLVVVIVVAKRRLASKNTEQAASLLGSQDAAMRRAELKP